MFKLPSMSALAISLPTVTKCNAFVSPDPTLIVRVESKSSSVALIPTLVSRVETLSVAKLSDTIESPPTINASLRPVSVLVVVASVV